MAMKDFMLLMHNDGANASPEDWNDYIGQLVRSGNFQGGSSIGTGVAVSKSGEPYEISRHITGYIRIEANDLDHARELVRGNPVFESGGTVEIRELPKD